jgi:class 3 adenylate cyclase
LAQLESLSASVTSVSVPGKGGLTLTLGNPGRAPAESEILVVVCTDLVDSTGLSRRLGEEGADVLRQQLFATAHDVVQSTEGQVVKSMGDGIMAIYRSVIAAIDGAIELQRGADHLNRRRVGEDVGLRVGMSVGEAKLEDGDWYGVPVVEAVRLCDLALGGEILANEIILTLRGERGSHEFNRRGTRVLKGFDDPISVVEIAWSGWEPAGFTLPFELERRAKQRFVGREQPLTELRSAWSRACSGQPRLALISGEPGIGKTAIAARLAANVRDGDAVVLYGHCDEQIVASFQPFSEALRLLVAGTHVDVLAAHAARYQGALLSLVPELSRRLRNLEPPAAIDSEATELRLFESVVDLLGRAAEESPILLVIDDLQWANAATWRLLTYIARHTLAGATPVLILALFRDTPSASGADARPFRADLQANPQTAHVELFGLNTEEMRLLAKDMIGPDRHQSVTDLADALRAETGGNPFLACEVLGHLIETGALREIDGRFVSQITPEELGTIDSIRGVMTQRLHRLATATTRALAVASVIGDEFDFRVLSRVPSAASDHSELARALDEGVAARLLVELPQTVGRYRFAHVLIRLAIADELSSLRRAQLDGEIAEAIVATYEGRLEPHLRDIAFHYCRGTPFIDPTPAGRFGLLAARHANNQLVYGDAVEITDQALAALEAGGRDESETLVELLAERAYGLRQSGDWDAGAAAQLEGVAVARALGSSIALARVLARSQLPVTPVIDPIDPSLLATVEGALASAEEGDDWAIAALLAWLTMHRAANGLGAVSVPLAAQAVEHAQRTGDVELHATALHALCLTVLGTPAVGELLDNARALRDLEGATPTARMHGHRFVALAYLIMGDRDGFARSYASMEALLTQTPSRYWRAMKDMWQPMQALMDGRFGDAETLIERVLGNVSTDPNQLLAWFSQEMALRREQDRLVDFAPTVDATAAERPTIVGVQCLQVLCRLAEGDHDAANALMDGLTPDGFAALPRDWLFPVAAAFLSVACSELGRIEDASSLYEIVRSYAGTVIVCASATYVEGAADRFLGILAGTMGQFDLAVQHLEEASAIETRLGSAPLLAQSQYWMARMLRLRNEPGDEARAAELLNESLTTAHQLKMRTLERLAASLTTRRETLRPSIEHRLSPPTQGKAP